MPGGADRAAKAHGASRQAAEQPAEHAALLAAPDAEQAQVDRAHVHAEPQQIELKVLQGEHEDPAVALLSRQREPDGAPRGLARAAVVHEPSDQLAATYDLASA